MTKQMKAALAATMLFCAMPLLAQTDSATTENPKTEVADPQAAASGSSTTDADAPAALHFKGITFTPGGFVAAESVFRTRALNSDINTPFSSVPYGNSTQAYLSEFNATGRQSRISLLFTGSPSWGKLTAYYEMDFLGAGTTSNNNQSNSYLMRQREVWGQAALKSGFTFTGGQMWSLVTEVKKGINEAPGAENLPQTIDPQYHVGFSWTRQYGARFAQQLGPNAAVALSLEGSQTILASTTNAPYNFILGAEGNTSGLLTSTGNGSSGAPGAQNYSDNVAPDIIVKFTADPKFGHFEVGGVARFFRDRTYLAPTGVNPFAAAFTAVPGSGANQTTTGGGFFLNGRVKASKYADVGIHIMQGDGVGRYGTSNLGDVIVKPNGTLEPLRSSQGLFSLETHPSKKLDVFGYAGGEYLQRTYYQGVYTNPTTGVITTYNVGYAPLVSTITQTPVSGTTAPYTTTIAYAQKDSTCGIESSPSTNNGYPTTTNESCSGTTRDVLEGSLGFTYRFYNNPKFGKVQFSMVYSYLTKGAWTGQNTNDASGFGSPKATDNMVFTGFRYYLP